MTIYQRLNKRIRNIERKFSITDAYRETFIKFTDEQRSITETIQEDIKRYKRKPIFKNLSTKELVTLANGEPVKTWHPINGNRIKVLLTNPRR
jgi:hypothetical protein